MHNDSQSVYCVEVSKLVGPFFGSSQQRLWEGWDTAGVGPSLRVPESRLTLRGSMQFTGRCVKFCRKCWELLEPTIGIGVY